MLECQSLLQLERRLACAADTPGEEDGGGLLGRSQETSLSTLLTDTSLSSIGGLGFGISPSSSLSSSPEKMTSAMPPMLPTSGMIPPAPTFPPPPIPSSSPFSEIPPRPRPAPSSRVNPQSRPGQPKEDTLSGSNRRRQNGPATGGKSKSGVESKQPNPPPIKPVKHEDSAALKGDEKENRRKQEKAFSPDTITVVKQEFVSSASASSSPIRPNMKVRRISARSRHDSDVSIPFNMENINLHLNQEKIDEMINIKGLQQTLGEVLTISDAELDGLLDCGDEVIDQLITPAGSMQAMADITAGEMEEHFKTSGAGEDWLDESGMASLLHCGQEDMDRMMRVNRELLDWEVNQGVLDDLLDTRQYTSEMVLERKDISGMTEVPGVGNMTRVLFRDLKKMTDVSNVETLTEVSKAEVDERVAIQWVRGGGDGAVNQVIREQSGKSKRPAPPPPPKNKNILWRKKSETPPALDNKCTPALNKNKIPLPPKNRNISQRFK